MAEVSKQYPQVWGTRPICVMAKNGEVACWFQPCRGAESGMVCGPSSRPSGRRGDRGPAEV